MRRIAWMLLTLILLLGCQPETGQPPTVPTTQQTTTTTEPTGAYIVSPSGGDDTARLEAAIADHPVVVVNRPLKIDRVVDIKTSNRTLTFVDQGRLVRSGLINPEKPNDTVTFQVILVKGASHVTINNPQIVGPGGICDIPRDPPSPGLPPIMQAIYEAKYESQHGISLDGTSAVTINGGFVREVKGDGVYITGGSVGTRIHGLTTRCTGRSSISNVSSNLTYIDGGFFERSGLWIFNIEPYGNLRVDNVHFERPKVGVSNWEWMWADGAGSNCNIVAVVVNKPDLSLRGGFTNYRSCGPGLTVVL